MEVLIEPFNFSFFSVTRWGIDLDYCDTEWLALETEIILLLLRLHPSTAFQTLLLTMREHNSQLWKCLVVKVKSDTLKNNIA